MRRSTIRSIGAALLAIPLVSTCTLPQGVVASASGVGKVSEERLISFLIDGSARGIGES
jgi:hypothetical protein